MFKPALETWSFTGATYSCIIELYDDKRALPHFRFFPKPGIFRGFSLYNINFAGRISEAAMGGAGGGGRHARFAFERAEDVCFNHLGGNTSPQYSFFLSNIY